MQSGKFYLGKPVISMTEGRRLGTREQSQAFAPHETEALPELRPYACTLSGALLHSTR